MEQDELVIERLNIPAGRRIIAISDIHGRSDLFTKLLKKAKFSAQDELILVGDLCEKGPDSLGVVRRAMELVKAGNAHVVMGNCDTVWAEFLSGEKDVTLPAYLKEQIRFGGDLIFDFARELFPDGRELTLEELWDRLFPDGSVDRPEWEQFRLDACAAFAEELEFLSTRPHIIETEEFLFAHAGINQPVLEENSPWEVMKNDRFVEKGMSFPKYLIVGHWPVQGYCAKITYGMPRVNSRQMIISIDGGIQLKLGGQLNALLLEGPEHISHVSIDDLPKIPVYGVQEGSSNPFSIVWHENAVEVLEWGEEFTLCRQKSSGREFWSATNQLEKWGDGWHCYDGTSYWLPVRAGNTVSLIERFSDRSLCKHRGRIGWIANRILF